LKIKNNTRDDLKTLGYKMAAISIIERKKPALGAGFRYGGKMPYFMQVSRC
jgi:hypothetical protein